MQFGVQEMLRDLCVGEGQGSLSRLGSCPAVPEHLKDQWDEDPTWPSTLRTKKQHRHLSLEEQKRVSSGLQHLMHREPRASQQLPSTSHLHPRGTK